MATALALKIYTESLVAETRGVEVSSEIGRGDGSFLFEGPDEM